MKKLLLFVFLFSAAAGYSQSTISGTYMIGDKKATISADEMSYWLIHENENSYRLQYEENTPENEQIWLVRYEGKQKATIRFKSDYSSGIYTDYTTGSESYVKKIP